MRRTWIAGAAVLALAASPVRSSNEFQDLRDRAPSIDAAVASMPSSAILGTLNRLSSMASRPANALPSQDQMLAAIAKLESQLRSGLRPLTFAERLIIAQVVQHVVIDDMLRIQGGGGGVILVPCPPDLREWGEECHPPVERSLDDVAEMLAGSIREGADVLRTEDPSVPLPPTPPVPAGGIGAANFGEWLQDVLDGALGLNGVEHIDS